MRIGELSLHGCIRMNKQAWSLALQGHETHYLASQIAPTHSVSTYASVHLWEYLQPDGKLSPKQIVNSIRMVDPHIDVWHVHNEPNWIFRAVHENTTKPVIFDIHDWTSLRRVKEVDPSEVEEERYALEHADGFCVPSQGYLKRIRGLSKKPSVLVYSMLPEGLFAREKREKKPGLVYAGGLKGKNLEFVYNYDYRNWCEVMQGVANAGHDVYGYSANGGEDFEDYAHERIHISPPEVYDELIRKLSQHTAGLVGTPFHVAEFDDAMPNKLFEYISAGIPVIVLNAPEAGRFVEDHDLGICVRDASEIPNALERLTDHNIPLDRWQYTMESQLPSLLGLYEEVLWNKRPRTLRQIGA